MANTSLRWGRIVLGGILAELLLLIAVVVVQAAGGGEDGVTNTAVIGSFVAFVPVAWVVGPSPAAAGAAWRADGRVRGRRLHRALLRRADVQSHRSRHAVAVLRGTRDEARGRCRGRLAGAAVRRNRRIACSRRVVHSRGD